ncbi:MAG: bifunctional hydroxymethylpyrimidine kinase/phosphomethylpyrimidine kinase [Pseudomonadota bacterium]
MSDTHAPTTPVPTVLSIAGSDPSGGAGIQADIKAISARGAYAMAAITALTAQNTQGVSGVHTIPPDFVAQQIDAVFADIRVDAVKIGMIANAPIAQAVAASLARQRDAGWTGAVVLDPVMVAKGGAPLLDPDAVAAVTGALVPLATVATPNLPELARLVGAPAPAADRAAMRTQAQALLAAGVGAVLAKGGHLDGGESPDLMLSPAGETWLEGPRVQTANTHGTGCTLAAALAAELAHDRPLAEAAAAAKAYVAGAIAAADGLQIGHGHGPTHHFHALWPAPAAGRGDRR